MRKRPWPFLLPIGQEKPFDSDGEFGTLVVRNVFQDVLHPAVQDLAQGVQGLGGDGLAVLHAVNGVGIHPLLIDQVVLGDPFPKEGVVEGLVADHVLSPLP